jgi:hypothetical protein
VSRALLVLLVALAGSGCATVEPWQRGTLAHRCMQVSPTPERAAAIEHVLTVREGAAGGHGASGGGCGCD